MADLVRWSYCLKLYSPLKEPTKVASGHGAMQKTVVIFLVEGTKQVRTRPTWSTFHGSAHLDPGRGALVPRD